MATFNEEAAAGASHPPQPRRDAPRALVLGMGTGRCGTHTLADLLNQQPDAHFTHEQPPYLDWRPAPGGSAIRERLQRLRRTRTASFIGDVASFYLPYIPEAIALEPDLRVICLERPREEVVESFCRWLDRIDPLPINHWAAEPAEGWHHDLIWSRIFPKYDIQDREDGIRRYWAEYRETARALAAQFPRNVRVFPMEEALNTEAGMRDMLSFAGFSPDRLVLSLGTRKGTVEKARRHPRRAALANAGPNDPCRCAVLVPYSGSILPACENGLRELERRGYPVWRVGGYAAIDQGRNQMATDALVQGFEETMWIDADIAFDPADVDRLRSHHEPIVCGVYPQKGRRMLACHVLPGTGKLVFGAGGGPVEILYAAGGFLLVRRQVYMDMVREHALPICNEHFGRPMVPFFRPMIRPADEGSWYLAEDFAFSEGARRCGYRIMADTAIRLWHIGNYQYGWEDAGDALARYQTYSFRME